MRPLQRHRLGGVHFPGTGPAIFRPWASVPETAAVPPATSFRLRRFHDPGGLLLPRSPQHVSAGRARGVPRPPEPCSSWRTREPVRFTRHAGVLARCGGGTPAEPSHPEMGCLVTSRPPRPSRVACPSWRHPWHGKGTGTGRDVTRGNSPVRHAPALYRSLRPLPSGEAHCAGAWIAFRGFRLPGRPLRDLWSLLLPSADALAGAVGRAVAWSPQGSAKGRPFAGSPVPPPPAFAVRGARSSPGLSLRRSGSLAFAVGQERAGGRPPWTPEGDRSGSGYLMPWRTHPAKTGWGRHGCR